MKKLIVIILLLFSNYLFAQNQIDSLESLLPNKQGIDKAILLNDLAYEYWSVAPDKGLEYAKMAYSIAVKEDSKINIAQSLQGIGVNNWAKSEFNIALDNYQKSLKIHQELNNTYSISSLMSNIGIVYKDLSDYENSLKYHFESLKISEENRFTNLYINTISNISSIYLSQKNYPKALEYAQEAIKLSEKHGNINNLALQLNTIGEVYESQKKYKKAKSTYQKCLDLDIKNGNNYGKAISLYNIGSTEYHLKNYNSAIANFNRSLTLSKQIEDQVGILLSNKSLGLIHKDQNQYNSALGHYKISLDLAIELNLKKEKLDIYKKYYELYKSVDKYDKSIDYLERFISLKDSIFTKNSLTQIAEMQTKYESEKKEKENELLRKNSEIQNLAIAKQTNLRNSFIGLSIIVSLMIISLLNRFRLNKKANKILITKNEVISNQRDKLTETNSTKDKFFSIISHDLRSPFNSILGFSNLLVEDYDNIDDKQKRKIINSLNKSTKLAYDLLANLLTWARTQTGKIEINKEILNLKKLTETSIAPYLSNALHKNIEIEINIPSKTTISLDKNTAITFISNLVSNAIKFTPQNGIIKINYHESKDNIELHFIDNGVGMSSEIIEKLFKIDENISTNGTNNEKGTGLGLILCKEFINKNGGDISVISEIGKGSDFIITLSK